MQNLRFTKKLKQISFKLMCLCLMTTFMSTQAFSQLSVNGVSATPSGYTPGMTNTIAIEATLDDPTGLEWADYLVFNFPMGWQVSQNALFDISTSANFCGTQVFSGSGTNVFTIGLDDPMGNPVGGSGCGPITTGTYTFLFDIVIPAAATGDQSVTIDYYGDGFLQAMPAVGTVNLTLTEILCMLTCPADIVAAAEPGLCGANLIIPAPTFVGACLPAPADVAGFYPVGTTEVTLTGGGESCTVNVTVLDSDDPLITQIADMNFSLNGGECDEFVTFNVEASDDCAAMPILLTQSVDPTLVTNAVACPGGANIYSRVFDLPAIGQTVDVNINNIEIGIAQTFNSPEVTVSIYELTGALSNDNLELVAESTQVLPDIFFDFFDFPITTTLEASNTYVVQVTTPGSSFNGFVMGTNIVGETGTSYMESSFCSILPFTDMNTLGLGTQNLVINLEGETEAFSITQTEGLPSGSFFPIGTTTNTFVATDASGNTLSLIHISEPTRPY